MDFRYEDGLMIERLYHRRLTYTRSHITEQCQFYLSDTPLHRMQGVLPSTSPLARRPFGSRGRGSLSRSVFRLAGGFPVPQGTFESLCENVERRVLIAVQDHATPCTDVGAYAQ